MYVDVCDVAVVAVLVVVAVMVVIIRCKCVVVVAVMVSAVVVLCVFWLLCVHCDVQCERLALDHINLTSLNVETHADKISFGYREISKRAQHPVHETFIATKNACHVVCVLHDADTQKKHTQDAVAENTLVKSSLPFKGTAEESRRKKGNKTFL